MFYKKIDNENWARGNKVYFPDGVLSVDNINDYELPYDGWEYYENEPLEYTIYKEWINSDEYYEGISFNEYRNK